ncbi:MAG: hypothetical protein WAO91_01900 [Candidatus Nitrosotenuis sp.]
MPTIIERKLHLTKEKTPSINYGHFPKIAEDLKTEIMKKSTSQNVLAKQISEKFPQLNSFDGKSVQVRQ